MYKLYALWTQTLVLKVSNTCTQPLILRHIYSNIYTPTLTLNHLHSNTYTQTLTLQPLHSITYTQTLTLQLLRSTLSFIDIHHTSLHSFHLILKQRGFEFINSSNPHKLALQDFALRGIVRPGSTVWNIRQPPWGADF